MFLSYLQRSVSLVHPSHRRFVDQLYYRKGAAVAHMVSGILGPKSFQKAMSSYVTNFAYGNVVSHDFLRILDRVALEEDIRGTCANFDINTRLTST